MGALDKSIGALLLGTWFNGCFYTLELIQMYRYSQEYATDGLMVKLAVLTALLVDTVSTVSFWGSLYEDTITHWGDAPYLTTQNWGIPIYCIGTGLSSGIVQLFLIARAGRLIKTRLTRSAVISILVGLSLTSTACAIWTGAAVVLFPGYNTRQNLVIPVTVWLTTSVGADVAIAATLLWQLISVRRAHAVEGGESRLSGVLQNLIINAIETGSATAGVALVTLATYLADSESNVTVGIGLSLGRIYTLTMLVSLRTRKTNQNLPTGASSSGDGTRRFRFAPKTKGARTPGIMVDGIQVNHVATVHVDEPIHLHSFNEENGRDDRSKSEKDEAYTTIGV